MSDSDAPSDLMKLLEPNEKLLLYLKQKKHFAVNTDSVAITNRRIIFREPSMLRIRKSFSDYSFGDIQNVKISKGLLWSKLTVNLGWTGATLRWTRSQMGRQRRPSD